MRRQLNPRLCKSEWEYLLAAVRRFFNPDSEMPCREGLDWPKLLRLAEFHGVMPLLHRACPTPELANGTHEIARFDLMLSAELARLLGALESHQIKAVPLKGPVLGSVLYGVQALRTSADLDLLVRPSDVIRTQAVLRDLGYRMESKTHWPVDVACFKCRDSQLSFSDRTELVSADVHWRAFPRYFPAAFDEDEMWEHLRSFLWSHTRVWTVTPEQQVLLLCLHGTKHLWVRLGWICDIARFVQVQPGIDWSEVYAQATRRQTTRMVSLGLLLVSDLLGVQLLPEVAARIGDDARARALASKVRDRLEAGSPATAVETLLFSMQAIERYRDRARFVFGIIAEPTEEEYCAIQLPPGMHWIYYLLRPLRLSLKYSLRATGL